MKISFTVFLTVMVAITMERCRAEYLLVAVDDDDFKKDNDDDSRKTNDDDRRTSDNELRKDGDSRANPEADSPDSFTYISHGGHINVGLLKKKETNSDPVSNRVSECLKPDLLPQQQLANKALKMVCPSSVNEMLEILPGDKEKKDKIKNMAKEQSWVFSQQMAEMCPCTCQSG